MGGKGCKDTDPGILLREGRGVAQRFWAGSRWRVVEMKVDLLFPFFSSSFNTINLVDYTHIIYQNLINCAQVGNTLLLGKCFPGQCVVKAGLRTC